MYNDPLLSNKQNDQVQRRIETKIQETVDKVTDESASDDDFNQSLLDLCQLNKMRDSHQEG